MILMNSNHSYFGKCIQRDPKVRALRDQLDRINNERQRQKRKLLADLEANRLRNEIRQLGETPCR